jgi:hypothetical protein
MEQILLHLIGDYLTQTDWMAKHKTTDMRAAMIHAATYSLPFLLLGPSVAAFCAILWTHFFIDHYRLARVVVFAKNWITDRSLTWADCNATGYRKDTPPWLAFWLLIIADNTLHLCINYAALRWL